MMDTEGRRPSRAPEPRQYRALVTLTYPATEEAARARKEGRREHAWAKALPGDPVPEWVVKMSPGIVKKGRVELVKEGGEA